MSHPDALEIVLASGSPRRRQLLDEAGVRFEVVPADIAEDPIAGEAPNDLVQRLAAAKARAVARRLGDGRLVLGADTIVVLGDDVLGKPLDARDADRLLARLLGNTHRVLTAVAIVDPTRDRVWQVTVESRVEMRDASEDERRAYVATGEGLDKAGAYAVQGEGRRFVKAVLGSESNVIGLPLDETLALLRCAHETRG